MKEAAALSIGVVKPNTGQTKYDWSIYGNGGYVTLADRVLLYHANENDFEPGEIVQLRNNDSNRKIKTVGVNCTCKANREDVLEMLYNNQYDYYPKKAFKKKDFNRKLDTSYSIKGITII